MSAPAWSLARSCFVLSVASDAEVESAHAAAVAHKGDYGIKEVRGVEAKNGGRSFMLLDLNNTWWEIATVSQAFFDAAFDKGDYTH